MIYITTFVTKNSIKMKEPKKNYNQILDNSKQKMKKFNLEDFLYSSLIPQNSVIKENKFEKIVSLANSGFCIYLFNL